MVKKSKKAIVCGILAAVMTVSLGVVSTSTVYAEGMAYRERAESGDYAGLREDQAQYIKNLEKVGKYDKADRMRRYYRNVNNKNNNDSRREDENGMDSFNRTHGRGNSDGSDGMAWRERQNENEDSRYNRHHHRDSSNDGMANREREDENGMDAFNRTHGR